MAGSRHTLSMSRATSASWPHSPLTDYGSGSTTSGVWETTGVLEVVLGGPQQKGE